MAKSIIYYLPAKSVFILQTDTRTYEIPVEPQEMAHGSVSTALQEARRADDNDFFSPGRESIVADFILPHGMYGVDFITLPAVKRSKLDDIYKAEIRSLYKNFDELDFLSSEIVSGKITTYRLAFMRKALARDLKEGFGQLGVSIEKFIPLSVALIEGALKADVNIKKAPAVIFNIFEDSAHIAVYGKDTMIGGLDVPFGMKALSDSRVLYEKQLYHADASALLVINAKEKAKSTKLTMAIDLDEQIDDEVPDEDNVIEANPDLPDISANEKPEEAEGAEGEEPEEEVPAAVKTLRKSAIRVLPKFMRREEPTTPEGYVVENFRMFEKRILMLIRDMGLNEVLPKVENIYIGLPEGYDFVIDALRENNPTYKWSRLPECGDALVRSGAERAPLGKMPIF